MPACIPSGLVAYSISRMGTSMDATEAEFISSWKLMSKVNRCRCRRVIVQQRVGRHRHATSQRRRRRRRHTSSDSSDDGRRGKEFLSAAAASSPWQPPTPTAVRGICCSAVVYYTVACLLSYLRSLFEKLGCSLMYSDCTRSALEVNSALRPSRVAIRSTSFG